ncbi:MAG: hypothetical protein AAGA62_11985, partial [Bacteroidota bacterium]
AIRAQELFFFSTANPVIETGGVLGESKRNILERIPTSYLPVTLFVEADEQELIPLLERLKAAGLSFPLIAKPDIGERGFLVEKLESATDLAGYLRKARVAFLLQEFIDLPLEISVMYHRYPDHDQGFVTSLCVKEMLSVQGDGISTVADLMMDYPRARLQLGRFRNTKPELLNQVPLAGETVLLEPIGNHCRGTTFLNGNHHIDQSLTDVFHAIGREMEGIHYGRFDLKCAGIKRLKEGKDIKILEFNGVAGEPAHIFDPAYPVWQSYRDIFRHWGIIYRISSEQISRGIKAMTLGEAAGAVIAYRRYMRQAKRGE